MTTSNEGANGNIEVVKSNNRCEIWLNGFKIWHGGRSLAIRNNTLKTLHIFKKIICTHDVGLTLTASPFSFSNIFFSQFYAVKWCILFSTLTMPSHE